MRTLKKSLFNSYFSHIYIEKKALNYDVTKEILAHFKESKLIEINHYKDIFCRSHQSYNLQKKSPKLILAVKEDNLIYKGALVCQDFGNDNFYYTSTVMNCIYDCEYCYLQGMYSSANVVVFVNIEDIFTEIKRILKDHPVYLSISYDSDILAIENILGYSRKWINFAKNFKTLKIELRTKSSNFKAIEDIKPKENVILGWTLSPKEVIEKYENKTPYLKDRILSIKHAIDKGWKVRLCFDPILYIENWREGYKNLIESTFKELNIEKIEDISIGTFRVSKDYLKKMKKGRRDSIIINYPFETINGVCSYSSELSKEMIECVYDYIGKYIDKSKIYIWKDE